MSEPDRLPLPIAVGSRWVWEPLKPHAREVVTIIAIKWNGEEWWITTETESADRQRAWNDLDRFVEACVLLGEDDER
jgi:hypothetical protein